MKNKILTTINFLMVFVPWTILPLREHAWALESPTAEIMIAGYAIFMIFSGIFTIITYVKAKVQNYLNKICLVINGIYLAGGIAVLGMMMLQQFI